MNYYDRDKNKYKFNLLNMKYINKGSCGKVYKYQDSAIKIYNEDTPDFIRLKPERFDQFKTITNPHFIRLKNIYTKKVFPFRIQKNFVAAAYESSYYEKDKQSIVEKPIDYLLDNLSEIEILLTYLTNEHIVTDDLRYDNIILQSNNIVLIDPDSFRFYTDSTKYIGYKNKENLVQLVNTILYHSLKEYDEDLASKVKFKFFSKEVHDATNVTHMVSKELKKYKTLKDYYMDNLK